MTRSILSFAALCLLVGSPIAQPFRVPDIESGRQVYQDSCASCHGAEAEGAPEWHKPNAAGELPAPPHDSTGHTWRHSDEDITHMIINGWRDPFNRTEHLTMPALGAVLDPEEIEDVIAYLKTLWTPEQRQFQAEKSEETSSSSMN